MHRGFDRGRCSPVCSQRGRFPNSERRRIDMDEKERASVEPATSPFESRLTRDELLKRGAAAAVAVGVGGSLGGVARAATRTRRRSVASTPLDTLVVAVEGDIDTFDPAFTVGSKPSQTTIQNTFDQLTQYKQVTKHADGRAYNTVDTKTISYFLLTMAAVTDPDHVKALDRYRVRIRMNQPNLLLLKNNTMHNTSAVEYEEVLKHAASGDKWAT